MTEPTELLPCPFCGGINIIHCSHHMYCHACGADGPDADSQHESEAIAAWNTRTPQPTQAQAEPKSGAKSFQTYGEANAYSKGYYAGKKAATQAQAGAVPLTDEQIEALPLWKRFVGLWPETRREIVRTIERHHGIKGGQHG